MFLSNYINISWIVVILCVGLFLLIYYLKHRRFYYLLSLLPGFVPHPIFGERALIVKRKINTAAHFLQVAEAYSRVFQKEGIFRVWLWKNPVVVLFSPETIQPLLNSTTEIGKSSFYRLVQAWFKDGLLTSHGNKWRTRRKLLTPTFHYQILQNFVPVFQKESETLVKKLEESTQKEWIDITPLITLCTLDIICETAMGIHLGAQEDKHSKYAKAVSEFLVMFAERRSKPWLWNDTLYSITSSGKKFKKTLSVLHGFTRKAIEERKKYVLEDIEKGTTEEEMLGRKKKLPFMDLLLYHHFNNKLTESDVCEEVDTFMFAGHDTTAMGITWALYNIGLHPEVQDKIYQELYGIFGDDRESPVTWDDVREMKYLECVITESLRLYPSAPMVSRYLQEDMHIKDFTIPKGSNVAIFFYALHRDPTLYPNPEVFDPDRFLPENCNKRHPYAYLPFSAGLRNCIGQRFALLEEKVIIANVIRNFIITSIDPRYKTVIGLMIILKPTDCIRLKIQRR